MAEASLRKFQPSAANPWDRIKAAHLLNRAGFGGRPEEISRLAAMQLEAAVEDVLNVGPLDSATQLDFPDVDFSAVRQALDELMQLRRSGAGQEAVRRQVQQTRRANRLKFQELRAYWLRRMIRTRWPLQEKMTLFWHGHLVSGLPETRVAEHMSIQIDLFRRMATGNFKDLILAISRDPAMLSYLDNNTNRKGKPNENYARELLELFTMGIGNFAETDVKEAARAFTGWTFQGNQFVFRPNQHDDGLKTFLGRTGNWDGTDIVNIIFEQPSTSRLLTRKLWEFFAYQNPEDRLLDDLAGIFRRSNWELKPVLRAIFLSEAFYSERALRTQIKSPVQLVVGAVRLTGAEMPEAALLRAMDLMGQALLYPPNVGGWPVGRGWVNTASILLRYNFSGLLLNGGMPGLRQARAIPAQVDGMIDATKVRTAGDAIQQLIDRFIQAPLDAKHRWGLLRAFGTNREDTRWILDGARSQEQLRSAVHLIMSMPEFQLT